MPATARSRSAPGSEPAADDASDNSRPRTISLFGLPPLPFPSREAALYYGGIAALVAAELIDWPVALAVVVGHEVLTRRQKPR